jgi:pyruvate-formate lyase-activating enzyme
MKPYAVGNMLAAEALLRLAKAGYVSTAMETGGHTQWTVLERLLPYKVFEAYGD